MSALDDFAWRVSSQAAQRAVAADPELRDNLCFNERLHEELWREMYTRKPLPKMDLAKGLASRDLSSEQLHHLLSAETRKGVLMAHIEGQYGRRELSDSAWQALLGNAKLSTAAILTDLLDPARMPAPHLAQQAATRGGLARLLWWIAEPEATTDAEVAAQLLDYDSWGAMYQNAWIALVLGQRPALVPQLVHVTARDVRTALAGCRHLSEPAHQRIVAGLAGGEPDPAQAQELTFVWAALAANPVADLSVVEELAEVMMLSSHESRWGGKDRLAKRPRTITGPYEQVENDEDLEWLLRRSLPSQLSAKTRISDLLALMANPHLGAAAALQCVTAVCAYAPSALAVPGVHEGLVALLARHPENLPLLVDNRWFGYLTLGPHGAPAAYGVQGQLPGSLEWASSTSALEGLTHEKGVRYLETQMPEDPATWQVAIDLMRAGFAGSLADLATATAAITA